MIKTVYNLLFSKKEPFSIVHFITNKCNAHCLHCFLNLDNPEIYKDELTLEEIKKLSKTFGNSLFNINLTGGEPFLREDINEITITYLKNTTIQSLFISTNGYFTGKIKELIDRFLQEKINKKLIFSISIDNFEEEHDNLRKVKGLFKNAIQSYKLINSYKDKNIIANIGITITDKNYNNVIPLYSYLKEQEIKAITTTIMRKEGRIKKIENKEAILESYKKLSKLIKKDADEGFGKTLQGRLMNAKNIIANDIIKDIYLNNQFKAPCIAGSLFGVIYANGDIYPCEILNRNSGNLREYNLNFLELWKEKKNKELKKFIKTSKCSCTYECTWSINIISNPKFILKLLMELIKK
ncbi:MAG TPA: radical SAM protein [Candidatus Nanoarchaeia archaeon]|nr:radical SAM protein [Candidatus Nanoarchaeia archaeon]